MRILSIACVLALSTSWAIGGPIVRMEVAQLGSFDIQLSDATPMHRDNFLKYVNEGFYVDSIIHRSDDQVRVIQGGGFYFEGTSLNYMPTYPPVPLEASLGGSNLMMTVGAARTSNPDSATSQWFINMADNTFLDPAAGSPGYTVFGRVVSGWDVCTRIYGLNVWNASNWDSALGQLPLMDSFDNTGPLYLSDFVIITRAYVVPEPGIAGLLAGATILALRRRATR